MEPNFAESTILMTKYIMEQFYSKSQKHVLPHLHPDVMWIGASDGQFYQSYDTVSRQLTKLVDLPDCVLSKQSYLIIYKDAETCAVAGSFIISDIPDSGERFSISQRLTFIWKLYRGQPKLIHMHVSNPLSHTPQDVHFTPMADQQTKNKNPLRMRGISAELYFLNPDEILYVEADNIHSIVHTLTTSFVVCHPLNEMEDILTPQFLRIHRSFIVNKYYVFRLNRYELTLKNGGHLPVPQKKYKEVKEALNK